jgi:hypothetical protein
MAPFVDKLQDDAAFQCLLLSQRNLLNRLKAEASLSSRSHNYLYSNAKEDIYINAANTSFDFEPVRIENFSKKQRLSLETEADRLISADLNFMQDSEPFGFEIFDEKMECSKPSKKRRRATLTYLDFIFDKCTENAESAPPRERHRVELIDSDDDNYGVILEDVFSDDEFEIIDSQEERVSSLKMNPDAAKTLLVGLESAMSKSQLSQQQIHDWDKKMGLKRSHSKTMRLSSRSRKQLRHFTQRDIAHLSTTS